MSVVAIIPARGGSKGIPRKNIVEFLGRPLIAWSIDAALDSASVDRVIVSTDDEEIAAVARQHGAEVPFLRPAELAGDLVLDLPVFQHALGFLRDRGDLPDLVVQLRPTSPIRPHGLVDQAVGMLLADAEADSVRAVCEPSNNPFKMWRIEDGVMVPLVDSGVPEQYNQPRQVLPTVYWQIGVIDVIRSRVILDDGSMSGSKILPLVVDNELAADIDDPRSLAHAEALAAAYGLGGS